MQEGPVPKRRRSGRAVSTVTSEYKPSGSDEGEPGLVVAPQHP